MKYRDKQKLTATDLRDLLEKDIDGVYDGVFVTYTKYDIETTDYGVVRVVSYVSEIEPGGYVVDINGIVGNTFTIK